MCLPLECSRRVHFMYFSEWKWLTRSRRMPAHAFKFASQRPSPSRRDSRNLKKKLTPSCGIESCTVKKSSLCWSRSSDTSYFSVGYHRYAIKREVPTRLVHIAHSIRIEFETTSNEWKTFATAHMPSKSNAIQCANWETLRISSTFYGPARIHQKVFMIEIDEHWKNFRCFYFALPYHRRHCPLSHFNTIIDRFCYYCQL